jgi:hypothetical protein
MKSSENIAKASRLGPIRPMSRAEPRTEARVAIDDAERASGWTERTAADVSSLMVELGRLAKAVPFYGSGSAAARSLAERACRALRSDLARAGPLELEVSDRGLEASGISGQFGSDHLREAVRALRGVSVQRIRFTEVVSTEALLAFAEALDRIDREGRPASQLGIEVDGEICVTLSSNAEDDSDSEFDRETLATDRPVASLGSALLRGGARSAACSDASPEEPPREKPDVHSSPLVAPASGPEGERLLAGLRELDRCGDDDRYLQLAETVAEGARALCDDGLLDEAIRAMLVLGDHAVGGGGRSAIQATVARATLLELAISDRLRELIDRACSSDTRTSVRAAQLLLTLGEHAVPALIERLGIEREDARRAQLTGLLIALGEHAVPSLAGAIASGNGPRARLGIRIAGEMQCPALAKPLRDLLCAKDGPLQKEAARALAEMGNSAAVRALLEALESKHERTAAIAAFSLGTLAAPRSRSALVRRLERATQDRSWNLAREILQALGQFQVGDRATARALLAWVQRGGPPWRRPDLELKLEAVSTLGQLSGPETTQALREIAGARLSARLCERARRILDRRGDGRAAVR